MTPAGEVVTRAAWLEREAEWLPTRADREFVASLMKPVTELGRFAGWIAPPVRGINHQPIEFDYVTGLPAA